MIKPYRYIINLDKRPTAEVADILDYWLTIDPKYNISEDHVMVDTHQAAARYKNEYTHYHKGFMTLVYYPSDSRWYCHLYGFLDFEEEKMHDEHEALFPTKDQLDQMANMNADELHAALILGWCPFTIV